MKILNFLQIEKLSRARYKRTIITAVAAILVFIIFLSVTAIFKNSYSYETTDTENLNCKYSISDNKIIITVKANKNIKVESLKVLFLTSETNTQHTIDEKIKLNKDEEQVFGFSLSEIQKELNDEEPTSIKVNELNGFLKNKEDNTYKSTFDVILIFAITAMITVIAAVFVLDKINLSKKEKPIVQKTEPKATSNTVNKHEPIKPMNDFRKKNPADFRCQDGHYVRSKAEREIDDYLFNNNINHAYEQYYKHPTTGKIAETDFYLPDYNLYIEYFGMKDAEYIKKREAKIKMYQSDKTINFEYFTYEDDNCMFDKLQLICKRYSIPTK